MSSRWNTSLLCMLAALSAVGCSREGRDIFFPVDPGDARREVQISSAVNIPAHLQNIAVDGDSVLISGTICKTWSPQNYAVREFFGTVQGGAIVGHYERLIEGERTFSCELWVRHNRSDYRVFKGIPVNDAVLTAVSTLGEEDQNRFAFARVFEVVRWGSDMFVVNTMRDDDEQVAWAKFRYTGVGSTDPDSLYLNDPAAEDNPVSLISAWSDFQTQATMWKDAEWQLDVAFPPGLWYVRAEDGNGSVKLTGCYLGNLELRHVVNITDDPQNPYLGFLVESRDGRLYNAGPDNRYGRVVIGS